MNAINRHLNYAALLGLLASPGCFLAADYSDATDYSDASITSVFTDLAGESCTHLVDHSDPNDTPYQVCSGTGGYSLIVRHVGSGRVSIAVATPAQQEFPLDLHRVVTRHMLQLGQHAEWRMVSDNARRSPVALIVLVRSHESDEDPARVTHSYFAVAKITPDEICVTDRILNGSPDVHLVSGAADSAREASNQAHAKRCLDPLPPLNAIDKTQGESLTQGTD